MSTYSSAVLALSPTAYWRCNDTSGTTLSDSSGNGYGANLTGTYTLGQTGLLPSDPTVDSTFFSTGYAVNPSPPVASSGVFGMVAWVRRSTNAYQEYEGIISWSGVCLILNSGLIAANTYGVATADSSTYLPKDDSVHMVAMICTPAASGNNVELFLDGASIGSYSVGTGFTPSTSAYGSLIGNYPLQAYYFYGGDIQDAALIPSLTATQIANLYAIGTSGSSDVTGSGISVQGEQESNGSGLGAEYVILNPATSQTGSIAVSGTISADGTYVAPVFKQSGTPFASTVHIVAGSVAVSVPRDEVSVSVTVDLSPAFADTSYIVVATPVEVAVPGWIFPHAAVSDLTTNSFTLTLDGTDASTSAATVYVNFIALGA